MTSNLNSRLVDTSSAQSLRSFLGKLQAHDGIHEVATSVSTDFEISAYLSLLSDGPAVYFSDVVGHAMPVIGNILATPESIALGLDTDLDSVHERLVGAIRRRIDPEIVAGAPVQDVVVESPDLSALPIPRFFEHETGPYITAGTIIARDPETGARNYSIARLKHLSENRAFIGIAPNHHLAVLARKAHSRGAELEIAVSIGNHPALLIASAYYLTLGDDEFSVAGSLLGAPVELVRCVSVPIEAPAHSEVILEGTLNPKEVVEEGRVSEFHGLYESYKSGPVVTFHAMTHRRDAIFQVIQPGFSAEHLRIGAVAIAATVASHVRELVSSVNAVEITQGGCGRLHALLSLHKPRPGDARKAIFATWASTNLIKNVTVVNSDIDLRDPVHVEWALATRMKPDRDLIVVPGVRADRAEPLETGGVITKLGIDACIDDTDREDWRLAQPPAAVLRRIGKELGRPTHRRLRM